MNIRSLLVLCFVLKYVCGLPAIDKINLESYENQISDSSYEFSYTLSDGQTRNEKGALIKVGVKIINIVEGSYSFKGTDGKTYRVEYSAGQNGYRAKFEALPGIKIQPIVLLLHPNVIKSLVG